jgi:hypothetical protein
MNVCHELKTILWLPQRTASRTIAPQFKNYNFINCYYDKPIGSVNYEHELSIPKGCEDYEIICSIRNPFSWMLSVWHWDNFYPGFPESDRVTFENYVKSEKWLVWGLCDTILEKEIKYPIRYENMEEDLLKIPWFVFDESVKPLLKQHNSCKSENLLRVKNNEQFSDYSKYYTEETFEIVKDNLLPFFQKYNYC